MDIKNQVLSLESELIALRRDFHTYPELGFEEFRTSKIIFDYLTALGLDASYCSKTGVVGLLKGKNSGKTIMLRCDIDALPVTEETGLPFASVNSGLMHACGHDGHTSMLMITAKILSQYRDKLCGNVKFVFQPNEEDAGAEIMINDGVLKNPKPDAVCGLHLWSPIKSGTIGIVHGPIMASSYYFKVKIFGKGGHGGAPHTAINPIDTASHVLSAIKSFHTLEQDSLQPTVISVCKIHAGTKEIIVPDTLELEGSIRCLHDGDERVHARFRELVESVCKIYRCTCEIEIKCGNTMLNNDFTMTDLAIDCAKAVVGEDNIQTHDVSVMLGDDFAEFSRRIPGVYYFVGVCDSKKATNYPHHHPKFNIDEDALKVGVEMQVRLALKYLGHI